MHLFYIALALVTTQPQQIAPPEIRVTGTATASAEPERAEIDLGVVTQAPTAKEAADANAEKLETVIAAVRGAVGPDGEIETQSYSLRPNYTRPRDGSEATIASYTASNMIRVSKIAIGDAAKVIDAATGAGTTNVQRLQFTVDDEEALKLQALADAALEARARAEALAGALGLDIVRVLSVTEGEPVVVRPYAAATMMQAEMGRAQTPVEPGAVEVRATVTLRVEVAER